eukprot:3454423-Amphidinium_carterae.1
MWVGIAGMSLGVWWVQVGCPILQVILQQWPEQSRQSSGAITHKLTKGEQHESNETDVEEADACGEGAERQPSCR